MLAAPIALVFIGTIILLQQIGTNQASIISVQAKPDQTKFCQQFQNDDGTEGERCIYKSMGECRQENVKGENQDHIDCHKRD